MSDDAILAPIDKVPTGIEGVDDITIGGLPKGRTTLVVGSSGSGKTVFAAEFLYRGITKYGGAGLFVTFEERPREVMRNVLRMGWDFPALAQANKLAFVDASRDSSIVAETGQYDLGGLKVQIEHLIDRIDAKLIVFDSIGALLSQFSDTGAVRRALVDMIDQVRDLGLTCVLTAERLEEYGPISKLGVEEFVADNVIVLRNVLQDEKCRRTIQMLKMRGDTHFKGEYPFTITQTGISALLLATMELEQVSTTDRVSTGNPEIDQMMNGGLFGDSIALVSGPTGSGKTLMCTAFTAETCKQKGERLLFLAYEESKAQLERNARSWGVDFAEMQTSGLLRVSCRVPESMGLEEHLLAIRREIEQFRPRRIVVDSVSALGRVSSIRGFREFIIGFATYARKHQICSLLTSTTPRLSGGDSITEAHISTLTDVIILLRYVEIRGVLRRGVAVIKVRGSQHDKEIREYTIDGDGMHVGKPFENVHNVILGVPHAYGPSESDHLGDMFEGT